jgi:hypothetical protein
VRQRSELVGLALSLINEPNFVAWPAGFAEMIPEKIARSSLFENFDGLN